MKPRILVVDDQEDERDAMALLLGGQQFEVEAVANGREALDRLWREGSPLPGLLVLDLNMPVMDGKEAIQRIRANAKWASLPVIALTADAMSGDRERYLSLGMTDYVSKPVDQRELLAKLYSVLKLEAPAVAPVAKTGT